MGFNVTPHAPSMVLKLPHRGIEGIADGDIDVLMGVVLRSFLINMNVLARQADIDADFVQLALVMMAMWRLDADIAADDAAAAHRLAFESSAGNRPESIADHRRYRVH
jgi:hypothetical protein